MARALIWSLALAALTPAWAQSAPAPGWTILADCAAAYRANASIHDPERAASMTAQISETADDYARAAVRALPKGLRQGHAAVRSRVLKRTVEFSRQPRADVERFIDACPQIEE